RAWRTGYGARRKATRRDRSTQRTFLSQLLLLQAARPRARGCGSDLRVVPARAYRAAAFGTGSGGNPGVSTECPRAAWTGDWLAGQRVSYTGPRARQGAKPAVRICVR